jgi:hypothetical protein
MKKSAPAADIQARLDALLARYDPPVVAIARRVMAVVEETHPELTRKVHLGWQAVAYHHPRAGYVCGVFVRPEGAQLLFEHGRQLADPARKLAGTSSQVRYFPYSPESSVDPDLIAVYISEAIALRA